MEKKLCCGLLTLIFFSLLYACGNNNEANDTGMTADSVPISADTSMLQNSLPDTMYDSSNLDTFPK